MKYEMDTPKQKRPQDEPQEKHFDVRDLNFELDCDAEEPHFLCSMKIAH